MDLEALTDEERKILEERYGDLDDPNTKIILSTMGEAIRRLEGMSDKIDEFMLSRAGKEEVKNPDVV